MKLNRRRFRVFGAAAIFVLFALISIFVLLCPMPSDEFALKDELVDSQENVELTKDFEHHVFLSGDTLNCSVLEASGYNDFHGCIISDIYNIVDTCCLESGDEKNTATYHLAILSPDYLDGGWNLYSDRVLLIRKGNDTFIYDNVISNEIYDAAPCERFLIPSEDENDGTFNRLCDFELEFSGGQGYIVEWNIGIRILDDKLYVVGLKIGEHNPSITYAKNVAFEYDERAFPLDKFERSMIDTVRNDKDPLYDCLISH